MTLIARSPQLDHATQRRFQRVEVRLLGRYMLESRQEYPCQTEEMSLGDMVLFAPVKAQIGERVVVYLDQLGRFAGVAEARTRTGFAIAMSLSAAKRDRLADQLTWFANRAALHLQEGRRHERITPLMRRSLLRLPNGEERLVKLRDVSLSGVAIETTLQPPIGSQIVVGATPAVVRRHFPGGLGAEFLRPFAPGEIDESVRL